MACKEPSDSPITRSGISSVTHDWICEDAVSGSKSYVRTFTETPCSAKTSYIIDGILESDPPPIPCMYNTFLIPVAKLYIFVIFA